MTRHRYLNPFWYSLRLSKVAARILPDPMVMALIGRAARYGGEGELKKLSGLVDQDRLAIDIGAADGVYAWRLARLARACIAFEPNPAQFELLRRRLPNVELHDCALSSRQTTTQLRVPVNKFALTGLGTLESANSLTGFSKVEHVDVLARTLDSFEFQDVGFIKIDVEGHEFDVLQGARDTILLNKPVLLIEIEERHRPNALSSVTDLLLDMGYGKPRQIESPQNYVFWPN